MLVCRVFDRAIELHTVYFSGSKLRHMPQGNDGSCVFLEGFYSAVCFIKLGMSD